MSRQPFGQGNGPGWAKRMKMNRRTAVHVREVDERDVGISDEAAAILPAIFDEPIVYARHYMSDRAHAKRTACGLEGFTPHTTRATCTPDAVTCPDCRAKLARRRKAA